MKKTISLFFLIFIFSLGHSQTLAEQKTFKVSGYSLATVGYPSTLVPLGKDKFAYIEYWTSGEGRKYPAYYLQGYNAKYEEEWFSPLSKQNEAPYKAIDLIRLKKTLAVPGKLYSPTSKREETYVKFFSLEGKESGALQKMSTLDKGAKGLYEDEISISSDSSKLLWMGHQPSAKGKKKQYFFSVFEGDGKYLWGKKLMVPHTDGKHKVHQAAVDGKGNLYLLLINEAPTNTAKDTLVKPWILRYDFRENKFSEYLVNIPGGSVPEGRIHVMLNGDLAFTGIVSDGSATGFMNGAKAFPTAIKWNKIILKNFNISRELSLATEFSMDVPESWTKRYGTNGANFAQSRLLENNGRLFWMLEEYWTQIHNKELQFLYYDVAVVALNPQSGAIEWANYFEKKQRDYSSGRLLSYVPGIAGNKLNIVYLNERGAQGKIVCSSFNLADGAVSHKDIISNFNSDYLFFPRRSGMVSPDAMMLMGVGTPNMNEYRLIRIKF